MDAKFAPMVRDKDVKRDASFCGDLTRTQMEVEFTVGAKEMYMFQEKEIAQRIRMRK